MPIQKENRLLRIGVLGCGPISQIAHFDAIKKTRNAELYAICDLAQDLRERMSLLHQPKKTYETLEGLLNDPEVEAVVIGTADQFHVPLALQCIQAGKHVLVEKPLGVTVEECETLRAAVQQSGKIFQVGNNRRFDPGVAFAAKFVREEMGGLLAFKSWYCDSTYRYTMTDNLQPVPVVSQQARKPAGNPKADKRRYFMLTHGSHLVDTARFLAGPLEAVRARVVERFNSYCWFVEVDFASGALGHLDLAIPIRGDFEEGFQIWGEHGSAKGNVFLPWFHKTSVVECFSSRDATYRRPLGEDAYSYKLQIENFAEAILQDKPQRGATVEDGLAAMRAMVSIARSAETGEKIFLKNATGAV